MLVSIIIPVYNEAKTIAEVIQAVDAVDLSPPYTREIIVINDGSNDGTTEALNEAATVERLPGNSRLEILHQPRNMGKGAAIRRGFQNAKGGICLIQDADLELAPKEHLHLLKPFSDPTVQAVYGSRFMTAGVTWSLSYFANRFLTGLTNLLYRGQLTDMETCFKVMRSDIIPNLHLTSDGFEIEPEITAKLLRSGVKISEVPVAYEPRTNEEGKKIRASDGIKAIRTLVRLRFSDKTS